MTKMLHKILSVLLAACLVLSAVPFPVLAEATEAIPANTSTNGAYTDGVWAEGGNGSVTHNIDGTDVTLSKTAAPVEGEANTFDITLKVETSTSTSVHTNGGAVVLVIDVSGSMAYCANCGGERNHSFNCTNQQSRMSAAKIAANNFLASYAGTDPSAARMVAIVSFESSATTRLEWVNVAGGPGKNSYDTALTTINNLSANGGTNLDDGLYHARTLLDNSAVSGFTSKNVIALTDGAPTKSRSAGDGTSGSATINSHTAAQATNVKNTGATLYTVCFGVADEPTYEGFLWESDGPTVGDFLSGSVASSGCAYNADNATELYSAFAAITESITSGLSGDGWTATDPMADMISVTGGTGANFSGADGTYTWKLTTPETVTNGNVTTYVYSYTYRVTLDVQGENFEEGKFFPTNEGTYLNVDGKQYAFPVPGVTGVLPRTDVSVTKVWSDADNQDGIRASSVTVQLMEGDKAIGESVVLSADNNWTHTWDGETYNLIKQSKGEFHVYTVDELGVPTDYTASATDTATGNFNITLTNSHDVYKKDVTVTKTWSDADNQDGIRPSEVTVNLLANGEVVATAAVTAAEGWTYTFKGLDVNKAGKEIVYTAEEASVPAGYTASANGLTITNTHEPAKTQVSVTKAWNDADNQDGKRPEFVTVSLLANGTDTGKTLTLTAASGWTGSFTGLDQFQAGKEIAYTVVETAVTGYSSAVSGSHKDGYTITNTHTPETTEVSGSKTWDDNNNQDGARPDSITIHLNADGTVVDTKTVTANDNWSWTFENLPKYKAGQEIDYTITEDAVEDYSTSYNGNNVINKHTPAQVSVSVTKAWIDNNDQDGIRSNDVTVILLANGKDTGKTLVLNEGNKWHGSFTELDKFAGGTEIEYTIQEVTVDGYTSEITGSQKDGYTITNTHTPETTKVSGSKEWKDNNNQDGARPESITINLVAHGNTIDSKTVTADDNWSWTFENLPKYENHGTLIEYSFTEETVEDYSTSYNGSVVINEHTPAQTSVSVTKAWADSNNQDGIRPQEVTVILLANGNDTGKTLTLTAATGWTGSFTGLDKFENGTEISYTVSEKDVPGYQNEISGSQKDGYTITNSHTPAVVTISGSKTWDDNDNQDGTRPESITINLTANGKVKETITVTADDNWSWSFENMPKFEAGQLITYAVTEEAVEDYTTSYNDYNVVNTHTPEKISVTVTKAWSDNNDQDGLRTNDVTVTLLANGKETKKTLVLSEGNNWTGSFTDLDKFAKGEEIVYTVSEEAIDGYASVITGDYKSGITITNSHTPETITISGSKTWNDADNQDGARPKSITINLMAGGKVVKTAEVTEADGWAWNFENLPKYENHGNEIIYTISEEAVEEYSAEYDGYNVTNSYTPKKISIRVTKGWQDANNQDGIRPEEIVVKLLANGKDTGKTLTLTAEEEWAGTFADLDKFAKGEEIVYTIEEFEVEGYTTVIVGDQKQGFVITNSHTPETIEVSGSKTWDDANNQDGKRPETITVNLLANGQVVDTKTVSAEEEWAWTFENLPKYENQGTEIVYTISEEGVEGYSAIYKDYDITNSYTPETINIKVTKSWVDSNDADGIRPTKVTIYLYANGEKTGDKLVLTADDKWTGSFTDLPKYENGEVIKYTIAEKSVKGYNAVIKGSVKNGFTVTNSHNYIPKTGDERTPILWMSMMGIGLLVMVVAGSTFFSKKKRNSAN